MTSDMRTELFSFPVSSDDVAAHGFPSSLVDRVTTIVKLSHSSPCGPIPSTSLGLLLLQRGHEDIMSHDHDKSRTLWVERHRLVTGPGGVEGGMSLVEKVISRLVDVHRDGICLAELRLAADAPSAYIDKWVSISEQLVQSSKRLVDTLVNELEGSEFIQLRPTLRLAFASTAATWAQTVSHNGCSSAESVYPASFGSHGSIDSGKRKEEGKVPLPGRETSNSELKVMDEAWNHICEVIQNGDVADKISAHAKTILRTGEAIHSKISHLRDGRSWLDSASEDDEDADSSVWSR